MSETETQQNNALAVTSNPLATQSGGLELGEVQQRDHHDPDQPPQAPTKIFVKHNLLDFIDLFTEQLTNIKDMETYLQVRSEFLQVLKLSEKTLALHETKTFIPMLEQHSTDSLRFGKWEVSYKPSQKREIDAGKLTAALPKPELIGKFYKKPEFKTLPECQRLMHKLGVYSDVFTTKQGKKPILKIIDTNTIKQEIEEIEDAPVEE